MNMTNEDVSSSETAIVNLTPTIALSSTASLSASLTESGSSDSAAVIRVLKQTSEQDRPLIVGCIADEFTSECLQYDCRLLAPGQANWQAMFERERPDFFFMESCWRGNDKTWGTVDGRDKRKTGVFQELLNWCRKNDVPTVFWNKEDPPHFERFSPIAKLFDYVFTSDANMVERYKADYGIQAEPMTFAAQPYYHNPSPILARKSKAVFAGTYYSKRPERCADFDRIDALLNDLGIPYDIYDRNAERLDLFPDLAYPEHYRSKIVGYCPAEDMWKIHKGYRYQINMNTVKSSPTMFARRVFESLASGTPVITNDSTGMRKIFGDLVVVHDQKHDATERLRLLESNPSTYQDLVLRGIREVMRHHTYAHRLRQITDRLGIDTVLQHKRLGVLTRAASAQEARQIKTCFEKRTWRDATLIVILGDFEGAYRFLNENTSDVIFVLGSMASEKDVLLRFGSVDQVVRVGIAELNVPEFLEDAAYGTCDSNVRLVRKSA